MSNTSTSPSRPSIWSTFGSTLEMEAPVSITARIAIASGTAKFIFCNIFRRAGGTSTRTSTSAPSSLIVSDTRDMRYIPREVKNFVRLFDLTDHKQLIQAKAVVADFQGRVEAV